MKSHVNSLLHVSKGILTDVRRAYPEYRGVDRDLARLTLLVKDRGLGVFTLDLPALDNLLTEGLENGRLRCSGFRKSSKTCQVPRLFSGLWIRIFDGDLCIRQEPDATAIALLRQLLCLGKKTEVPCSYARSRAAILEYIHVESTLPRPKLGWDKDDLDLDGDGYRLHLCDLVVPDLPLFPDQSGNNSRAIKILLSRCQQVADIVSESIGPICSYSFTERNREQGLALGLRHGPGAVADKPKGQSLFDKYDFPSWPQKLERVFPYELFGKMPNDPLDRPSLNESPSILHCVPKTQKGPRIIAAEPTAHMWCQKAIRSELVEKLKDSVLSASIDFRRQELSQKLVQQASLKRHLATVDLSSASDRLSCAVVERIFRRNPSLLTHLHASRTRFIKIDKFGVRDTIRLNKFASQGTDVTFPVQTIVFAVIAISCLMTSSNITKEDVIRAGKQVRVYGDDIILPTHGYAKIVELLHALYLKVNQDKSFSAGFFRESCGVDMYKGYDVTPIKPKTTIFNGPASCKAVLDTCNNLFNKGFWYGSEQLREQLNRDPRSRFATVGRDAVASGYISYFSTVGVDRVQIRSRMESRDSIRRNDSLYRSLTIEELQKEIHSSLYLASDSGVSGIDPGNPRKSSYRERMEVFLPHQAKRALRYNHELQRLEVRVPSFWSYQKFWTRPRGYAGMLEFAISDSLREPSFTRRDRNWLPAGSTVRNGSRWVPFIDLSIRVE